MKRTVTVPEGTDWFTEYRESTYVPARRGWGKVIIAAFMAATLLFAYANAAQAKTEHCPSGGVKVESVVDGDLDLIVPSAGTLVCVKGSTDATGIVVADGETTLVDILGNGHNVSYYVTYGSQATDTPEVTPSAPPATDSPTSEPSVTPTDEPTDAPSASAPGSSLPSPSEPTGARPTPPDTAASATGSPANSNLAIFLIAVFAGAIGAATYVVLTARR